MTISLESAVERTRVCFFWAFQQGATTASLDSRLRGKDGKAGKHARGNDDKALTNPIKLNFCPLSTHFARLASIIMCGLPIPHF
jgi:hypothetical protein